MPLSRGLHPAGHGQATVGSRAEVDVHAVVNEDVVAGAVEAEGARADEAGGVAGVGVGAHIGGIEAIGGVHDRGCWLHRRPCHSGGGAGTEAHAKVRTEREVVTSPWRVTVGAEACVVDNRLLPKATGPRRGTLFTYHWAVQLPPWVSRTTFMFEPADDVGIGVVAGAAARCWAKGSLEGAGRGVLVAVEDPGVAWLAPSWKALVRRSLAESRGQTSPWLSRCWVDVERKV